ncbi:hypothetical protein FB45DRAFT_869518 [Roridomyces roridus]|uniref:Uncharacterized protein n=1 Tax=Roridomyces roridus TaxID=1738132 RepID=A0AAD7FHN3_9AGAR|nr:hypothetical protein FB45DRAFT_869518 [Roridomyces roridus]
MLIILKAIARSKCENERRDDLKRRPHITRVEAYRVSCQKCGNRIKLGLVPYKPDYWELHRSRCDDPDSLIRKKARLQGVAAAARKYDDDKGRRPKTARACRRDRAEAADSADTSIDVEVPPSYQSDLPNDTAVNAAEQVERLALLEEQKSLLWQVERAKLALSMIYADAADSADPSTDLDLTLVDGHSESSTHNPFPTDVPPQPLHPHSYDDPSPNILAQVSDTLVDAAQQAELSALQAEWDSLLRRHERAKLALAMIHGKSAQAAEISALVEEYEGLLWRREKAKLALSMIYGDTPTDLHRLTPLHEQFLAPTRPAVSAVQQAEMSALVKEYKGLVWRRERALEALALLGDRGRF